MLLSNLHVAHVEHKTKDFPIKIFQKTSEKHWQKNLHNILEFLPIKRLRFRAFTLRKTEILIMLPKNRLEFISETFCFSKNG